jgi:hypothetical protein
MMDGRLTSSTVSSADDALETRPGDFIFALRLVIRCDGKSSDTCGALDVRLGDALERLLLLLLLLKQGRVNL